MDQDGWYFYDCDGDPDTGYGAQYALACTNRACTVSPEMLGRTSQGSILFAIDSINPWTIAAKIKQVRGSNAAHFYVVSCERGRAGCPNSAPLENRVYCYVDPSHNGVACYHLYWANDYNGYCYYGKPTAINGLTGYYMRRAQIWVKLDVAQ